jgi:paraquat-inducible protein B
VLGFFVISAFWVIPGIIMIIGGILTFKKPKVMEAHVEGGQGYV